MDLKVVRFIREASERQLVDIALVFIQRYPKVALELCAEAPEPGVEITTKDVSVIPRAIFISEAQLADFQNLYQGAHGGDNKVAVVKEIRNIYGWGLREAIAVTDWLIDQRHLKVNNISSAAYGAMPHPPAPRF